MPNEPRELLKPDEVAGRLKVSRRQVYRLVIAKHLEASALPGTKTVRIFADSVEDYIQRGSNVSTS